MFGFQKLDVYRCAVAFLRARLRAVLSARRRHRPWQRPTVAHGLGLPVDGGQMTSTAGAS